MRRSWPAARGPIGLAAALALVMVAPSLWAVPAGAAPSATSMAPFDAHIDHIVFLLQENHPYDSLFGNYCPSTDRYCPYTGDGIPAGTCVPLRPNVSSTPCIVPYNFTVQNLTPPDLLHTWGSTHAAWNQGAMNNFWLAELKLNATFGHYNGTTAPVYWDLAEQYGLADDFFSSAASYSLPNHWYTVSARPPNATYKNLMQNTTVAVQHLYLDQANATTSIESELLNSSVTWDWFDTALPSYGQAIHSSSSGLAYNYWDPLAARAQSYQSGVSAHFQNRSQFFGDAANGTLPEISWVIPAMQNSDHPPYNLTSGQDWVSQVVDALELSPEWNSTVLFVSWDEYGGFYDHVAPPHLDAYGDGFRVPLLAIGPWVKQGYIDPTQMDFGSILHLMEERFGLKCLGPRDCQANLPLAMFDFKKGPRAPIEIYPYGTAVYPMPLESSGKLPYYGLSEGAAPVAYREPPPVPLALLDDPAIDWS